MIQNCTKSDVREDILLLQYKKYQFKTYYHYLRVTQFSDHLWQYYRRIRWTNGLVSRTSAKMFTKLKTSYNIYGFLIPYILTPSSKQQRHVPHDIDSLFSTYHKYSLWISLSDTIINGMLLLSFIAYHRITHVVDIPSQLVVLDSSLSSSEHISRLVFPVSSTNNALMSVQVLFVSSLSLGTRPHTIFMNIFFWIFSRVTFYRISQYSQIQHYKAESPFTKSANSARLSTAKWLASLVAQQQQCCSFHKKKPSNNPLYTAQYAASWGCNLWGVQILPESMRVLTNFETGQIQD